jgi:selenophosphate synthetase-related protein
MLQEVVRGVMHGAGKRSQEIGVTAVGGHAHEPMTAAHVDHVTTRGVDRRYGISALRRAWRTKAHARDLERRT